MSLGVTGGDDGFAPAHAAQGGGGFKAQFPGLGYNQVGNFVGFKVAPHIFHRIEFRRIGGKPLDLDSTAGRENIISDQHAAVNGRSIPDDQDFPGDVPLQMLQKFNDLEAFNATGVNLEVKLPKGQTANDREAFPIEGLLEDGGLAARRPGARARRPGAQSAFVNKDDGAALLPRFFLKPAIPRVAISGWPSHRAPPPDAPVAGN